MKLSTLGWGLVIGVCVAQAASQGIVFKDKAGNMELTGLTGWRAKQLDDGGLTFSGTGNPFTGKWRDQGLVIRAKTIDGSATRSDKTLSLSKATIGGGVRVEFTRDERETGFNCGSAVYDASSNQLDLKGGVTMVSTSSASPKLLRLTGSSGQAVLYPSGSNSDWLIRSASLQGPIQIRIETVRNVPLGGGKSEDRPTLITGSAGRATYDDATRTLVLTGNVHLEGDDNVVGGSVDASKAVIRLNQKREVIELELTGEPGRTTFQDRPTKSGGVG